MRLYFDRMSDYKQLRSSLSRAGWGVWKRNSKGTRKIGGLKTQEQGDAQVDGLVAEQRQSFRPWTNDLRSKQMYEAEWPAVRRPHHPWEQQQGWSAAEPGGWVWQNKELEPLTRQLNGDLVGQCKQEVSWLPTRVQKQVLVKPPNWYQSVLMASPC